MKHFAIPLLIAGGVAAQAAGHAVPDISFVTPTIVRVRWNHEGKLTDNGTGAVICQPNKIKVKQTGTPSGCIWESDSLRVVVTDGDKITFAEKGSSRVILEQDLSKARHQCVAVIKPVYDESSAHMEETANGKVTVKNLLRTDTVGFKDRYMHLFKTDASNPLYGLGSHMEDYMDLRDKTLWLTQHNLKAFVPVLVSPKGFGLLFDAGCSMKYASRTENDTNAISLDMEAASTSDYYFIKGHTAADVVGGYRYLTGNVSMMPRYLFGYTQSRERYRSSDEIVSTLKEYRRRHIPIDMIVQDWNYWPEGWGYMKMDPKYYPDPKALADSVHAYDAKLMVSIWPNPQYCPEERDLRQRGMMLEHSVYNVFDPAARDYYWSLADNEFFSRGFDAWWCDSSEPLDGDWNRMPEPEGGVPYGWESQERRWRLNDAVLSESLGAERACLYSLNHSKGIYEHQRAATGSKRVVNLTRSTYAGQQRYGTIVWNGDTHASWKSFKQQIPAGLNYMATGNPYWTVDAGGFFTGSGPQWFRKGEFAQGVRDDGFKEYYVRMLQWCAFLPMMRSHGTDTPREIWQFGEEGTPYYDAVKDIINLRYALLPYNYSLAAMQSSGNATMARPLAFDFPEDPRAYDLKDQYMYGDLMVCPVTDPGVTSRKVYLPESDSGWIDFWTGERFEGGHTITAPAPLAYLPVYAKGGSIVTTCEPKESTSQSAGLPVHVWIYPGKDARFAYYDDAGDGYGYEKGESTRIAIEWKEKGNRLTIGDAQGTYPGSPEKRTFVIHKGDAEKTIRYRGKKQSVKL